MKKLIALLLAAALCLSLFAGCRGDDSGKDTSGPSDTTASTTPNETTVPAGNSAAEDALAYVKVMYKDADKNTPKDYSLVSSVPIGGETYPITWSVDVPEDVVKIVVNEDGTITVDVNEALETETPYVLTATITDADGNTYTVSFDRVVPAAISGSQTDIVDMAYALEVGEAMANEATLTGVITAINTPYDSGYKNITVTIAVEGREDKPIMCYRLKGEGADKLAVGDTITVTGTLKNYNGTIEFDAGCTLDSVISGGGVAPVAPDSVQQILDEAYALAENTSLGYSATLTGVITKINTPYDSYYNNITVTIEVPGYEDKPIVCFRLKGEGADMLAVGDTITVTGILTNYYGTVEFTSGCTLDNVVSGGGTPPSTEVEPDNVTAGYVTNPAVGTAYKLGLYQTNKDAVYYFTGEMSGYYGATEPKYNEGVDVYLEKATGGYYLYFKDSAGAKQYIKLVQSGTYYNFTYGTGTGSVFTYDADLAALCTTVGDEVCYMGTYGSYVTMGVMRESKLSSTDYIARLYSENSGNTGAVPTPTPDPDPEPTPGEDTGTTAAYVTEVTAGTAYKLGLNQTAKGEVYYFTGTMSGYYGATETGFDSGVDVYLESTTGGYYLYFKDSTGAKQYINLVQSGTHYNFTYGTTASSVFAFDEAKDALHTTVGDKDCYMGTYGNYVTMGVLTAAGDTDYIARLYTQQASTGGSGDSGDSGDSGEDSGNTGDSGDTVQTVVTGPYKFYVEQVSLGKTLYFNGTVNTNEFLNTTENAEEAVDVYVETTGDEVRLYFLSGETKTYVEIYVNASSKVRLKLSAEPTMYYTYSEEAATYVADLNGTAYYIGTYGTYATLSPSAVDYITGDNAANVGVSQFVAQLGTPEPVPGSTLTIPEAIDLGTSKEHNTYTEGKYYVTGVITEVYNATYGNMYITDDAGNTLTIYGTYDADGTNRYDAMETKPVAGDTVTVYGVIGQYNGTAQMKNGWITEHTPGESSGEEETPADPEAGSTLTIPEALALGASKEHNTYTEGKYYVTGVITEVYNATYGNMYITDDAGNTLTIYGTYDADGTNRYDAMATKPVAGDTVTVYGVIGQYNGTAQMKNGWITEHTPADSGDSGDSGETVEPVVTGPYKFYVEQVNLGTTLYFNGAVNSSGYLTTTENVEEAADVYVETTGEEVRLYFLSGETKTYIEVYLNASSKVRLQLVTESTMHYTYSEEAQTYVANINGTDYYIGTYNTYNTLSASSTYYITGENAANVGVSQFVAQLAASETGEATVTSATITFADTTYRTVFTTEQQVWEQNGITVTNDKASSTNDVANYTNPIRCYKGSSLTIAFAGMKKIEVTCGSDSYAATLQSSITAAEGVTVTVSGSVVTIELDTAADSYVIENLSAQVRVSQVTVYTA